MRLASISCIAVILGLALTAAAEGPKWKPEELTEKFDEIDKKLDALPSIERHEKATDRRLVDLEGKVRTLRSKLGHLEFQVRSLTNLVKALRIEIADLGGKATVAAEPGAEAGETAEPVPGAPTVTMATIRSQQVVADGDFLNITGIVANQSAKPLSFVVVEASFLDDKNSVVKTASGYTNPRVLGPGATASFKIVTRRDNRIRNHRLRVRAGVE